MIDQTKLISDFCELVKITCSTGKERQVVDVVKGKLTALGLEVGEDNVADKIKGNAGNVFGYLSGTVTGAPVIMLSAHLDSVAPCAGINPQIADGVIKSDGTTILGADDKAGVAGILEALRIVKEQGLPHGDIQVVFTVAEEGGLNGSKYIDTSRLKADFGYALDSGGEPGRIINSAPGQDSIKATIHGKSAHAGIAPEEGINAIVVAAQALTKMTQGRIDHETTANVGIIKGGQATNIVPDKVVVECEARSRDLDKLAAQSKHMADAFNQAAESAGAKADVDITSIYSPFVLADNTQVISVASAAAKNIGLTPILEATGGGSDANFFNAYGVPTAVLGVGMSKVHTCEEFITVADLCNTAELVLAIIGEAAKTQKA